MTIKIKLKKANKSHNFIIKFDLEILNDPLVKQEFQCKIGGRFAPLMLLNDMQQLIVEFSKKAKETANAMLGKRRKINKPSVTNDVYHFAIKDGNLGAKRPIVRKILINTLLQMEWLDMK